VIDSTCVKGQRAAGGARIKRSDARAAAGRTKVDAPTDVIGRSYALMLTAGNVSDVKAAHALLERAGPMRYLFADIRATLQPAANAPSPEIWPASAAFAPDGPVCPVFFPGACISALGSEVCSSKDAAICGAHMSAIRSNGQTVDATASLGGRGPAAIVKLTSAIILTRRQRAR
jgi:hypothetical protein